MGTVLIANLVLISAELTDLSKSLDFNDNTITTFSSDGISYEKTADGATITFKGGEVTVKGNSFANIKSEEEAKLPSKINLDKDGKVTNAEFTVNEKGGNYVFGNTQIYAPPNSRVMFDEKTGIRIKIPEGSEMSDIPKQKDISIPSEYTTIIEGNNYKLPNKAVVNGKLGFDKNGQAFVSLDDKTIVNGVELTSGISKRPREYGGEVNVFFDGQKHEGDYASFDLKNKKLILSSEKNENFITNFNGENPFLKIDEGDYVTAKPLPGGEIEIQNRDEEGLIPRVTTRGNFIIDEDGKSIFYKEEDYYRKLDVFQKLFSNSKSTTTSPIELDVFNKDGLSAFKNKILVDNFNRFIFDIPSSSQIFFSFFSESDSQVISLSKVEGIPSVVSSSRINYNYPSEESLIALTGKELIFSDVSQGGKDLLLGRLRDYWGTLTPETQDSFNRISFLSRSSFEEQYKHINFGENRPIESVGAFAGLNDIVISQNRFDFETFRHEAAHELHLYGVVHQNEKYAQITDQISKLQNQLGSYDKEFENFVAESDKKGIFWHDTERGTFLNSKINEIGNIISSLDYEKWGLIASEKQLFDNQWNSIVGENFYNGGVGKLGKDGYWKYKDNPSSNGPERGLIMPYGSWNIHEDVATFVGEVNNPKFFAPLINPDRPDYDIRYRQKLDLLHQYKFISDSEYNKILEVAGVK